MFFWYHSSRLLVTKLRLIKIVRKHRKPETSKDKDFPVNERITAQKLMVIDDLGENLGELSREEALRIAEEKELDLVLVSPNAETPVARIVDWSKFKYERGKKARKAKQKTTETKEWWFNSTIEDFHLKFKMDDVKKFLVKSGGTAKITVKYVNKTDMALVQEKMNKILEITADLFKPVSEVIREGRNLSILVKNK